MKKITALILALLMALSLCACGGKDGGDKGGKVKKGDITVKMLVEATLQQTGFDKADLIYSMKDENFSERFEYFYGIDVALVSDAAIACSSSSQADELSVLKAAKDTDINELTAALENRCVMQKASYELYSPESVDKLNNALIFTVDDYAVLIVSDKNDELKSALETIISEETAVELAQAYEESKATADVENFDYTKPVSVSDPEDDGWFKDAVFIGDSRMAGIMKAAKFEYYANLSHEGLTVADVFTKANIELNGGYYTVADALGQLGTFGKCYIMMGLNELGWYDLSQFTGYYADLIELVKETHPEAQIYVIGIMPVGRAATESADYLNNERVQMFNEEILKMTQEEQVYYIDGFAALQVDGGLPDAASPDGVHMEPGYCKMLTDYLKSHTV